VTLPGIQFAFENDSELVRSLALRDENTEREQLIDRIVAMSKGDTQTKAHLRADLTKRVAVKIIGEPVVRDLHPTQQLRTKAAELETRHDLSKMSPDELRALVKSGYQQRPSLPLLPSEFTAEVLKKARAQEIRRLVRHYGHQAINARPQGRG
jgi:hypothetical protein